MVDHSIEEGETEFDWKVNLANKQQLLQSLTEQLGGDGASFVPVKITALASPLLLEEMSTLIKVRSRYSLLHCH